MVNLIHTFHSFFINVFLFPHGSDSIRCVHNYVPSIHNYVYAYMYAHLCLGDLSGITGIHVQSIL